MNTVQDSANGIAAVEDVLLREQRFLNAINLESAVTPQQLTANANDYSPPQLRRAALLRLAASTPVNITGLATGRKGRLLVIENIGTNAITLKNLSASSRPENQFNIAADLSILANQSAILLYDKVSASWALAATSAIPSNKYTKKIANYTVTSSDNGTLIDVDCTTGNVTITFPTGLSAAFNVRVRRIDSSANAIVLQVNGADGIDQGALGGFRNLSLVNENLLMTYTGVAGNASGQGWIVGALSAASGGLGTATLPVSGQIPVGNTASTGYVPQTLSGAISVNASGVVSISGDTVAASSLKSANRPPLNYLINGAFDVNQRGVTTMSVASGTDKYAIDRWKVAVGNTDVTFGRIDTNGALESGLNARYYGKFTKATNTAKIMLYQWLEGINTLPLAGRSVTFQCKIKATLTSADKKFRIGLIQLNSSGTIDAPTNNMISAPGVASTDPTLGTNFAYVTTSLAVPVGALGTVNGNGVDCTTTTSWQLFAATMQMPTNMKNVAVAIWSDDTMTSTDFVAVSEAQFVDGASIHDWLPLPYQQELARCQRYFVQFGGSTNVSNNFIGFGSANTTSNFQCFIPLPVGLRGYPVLTITPGQWTGSDFVAAAVCSTIIIGVTAPLGPNQNFIALSCTQAGATWTLTRTTWLYASTSGATMLLDADF